MATRIYVGDKLVTKEELKNIEIKNDFVRRMFAKKIAEINAAEECCKQEDKIKDEE